MNMFMNKTKEMASQYDILIVHQFENMIINVFGMHFDFGILHVSTIVEVPLLRLQIGPCLKCDMLLLK